MRRREIFTFLIGAAAFRPYAASAQQAGKTYRIGMVETVSAELNAANLTAFRQGMRDLGYVEGRNFLLEYRSAEGDAKKFPALLADLIGLRVDLIVVRGTPAALAAKQATGTIPVVIAGIGDPLLVVRSLARPEGNITGLSGMAADLDAKRVQVLTEMAPARTGISAILNLSNPLGVAQLAALEAAARGRGLRFRSFDVRKSDDIERAFAALAESNDAVVVVLDAVTQANRNTIAALAAKHRLPAIYGDREYVEAGGLMSYAPSIRDNYRRAASYIDKIFKGAKPADLPVEQPTKVELLVNGRAAKALGLEIPASLQLLVDEVID